MNITLIHDWLTGLRGGEKCLDVLCRQFPHAELLTLLHRRHATTPAIERMRIRTSWLNQVPGIARHYRWWLPLMPLAIESLNVQRDCELVVSFSHAVAKGVIAPRDVPHICYCFTPMRYAWHLRDEYFGPMIGRHGIVDRARDALLDRLRQWDREASQRVTHFVAISHTVERRIAQCYGRSSTVIYPPVDTDFYTLDETIARDEYYLCVSALVPYKRIDLAVRACRLTGRRLVVIGAGPERARLENLAGDEIEFLGWQPDEVIRDHLRRCRALIFPGEEDFGIVPVEAQACGTPVIALARGGATETVLPATPATPGTGVFFAETYVNSLIDALDRLEAEPDACDSGLARVNAERFHTARYETELLGFIDRVVQHDPGLLRLEVADTDVADVDSVTVSQ